MSPIERKVSGSLREKIASTILPALQGSVGEHGARAGLAAQPDQVLRELAKYKELLSRDSVRNDLGK